VYYSINEEASFGLDSSEKRVQFVGIAEHVGHAMTFKILAEDTLKIIYHSCVHAATEPVSALEEHIWMVVLCPQSLASRHNTADGEHSDFLMPFVNPGDLIGKTFLISQE